MPGENPGAFDEARKRIRETKENENVIIEKKTEDFEKGKKKIRLEKTLDVFGLKHRIETGHSLNTLKNDIKEALKNGQISIDTYDDAIRMIDSKEKDTQERIIPEYFLNDDGFPFSDTKYALYFKEKKFGENPLIDIAGFAYGFTQGSIFLLFLLGRMILDTLLLPVDIYKIIKEPK